MQATQTDTGAPSQPLLNRVLEVFQGMVFLAVIAGVVFYLLWIRFNPGFGTYPFVVFFAAAAVCLLLVALFRRPFQAVYKAIANFASRRGAFQSDPVAEAPKFALIRVLFGAFLIERAIWILIYFYPTDWSNPILVFTAYANLVASILICAGLFTQAALVFQILFMWQFGDAAMATNTLGNDVAALLALLLILTNAGAHYSADGALMRRGGILEAVFGRFYFRNGIPDVFTYQNAKVLVIFGYWCICVYSLMSHVAEHSWMSGNAGPHLLSSNFMSRYADGFETLFASGTAFVLIGRIALWLMLPWYLLLFPCLFLGRVLRGYAIIWGLLFFALSGFVLQLGWLANFEFLMFAGLFWQKRFIQAPHSLQVGYDDTCNLCDRTVTVIKWVDVFRRVELKPLSQNAAWLEANGLTRAEAMQDLYAVETLRGGKKTSGYEFYVTLTRNVFFLIPFYPVLLLGRVTGIGPAVYRRVADRRVEMFGVCSVPTHKPSHEPPVATAPRDPGVIAPAIFFHVGFLGLAYLLMMPAPLVGWRGAPFPEPVHRVMSAAATGAHFYGITPINVFNQSDLRLAENWFTLSAIGEDGEERLLPVLDERGHRLEMHRSDRMYFGNTGVVRRSMIGSEGCQIERYSFYLSLLEDYFRAREVGDAPIVIHQYKRLLADEETLIGGRYVPNTVELVCTEERAPAS